VPVEGLEPPTYRHVRSEIEQGSELRTVAGLATRQAEGEWFALEVALEVDLGRKAAS
jgi:hypothetical protein